MPLIKAQQEAATSLLALLDVHRIGTGPNERLLTEAFQVLPPRRELPDYYDVISKPMAFSTIKSSLKNGRYSNLGELLNDIAQIIFNAKLYNRGHSLVYKDASAMETLVNGELTKLQKAGVWNLKKLPTKPGTLEEVDWDEGNSSDADAEDASTLSGGAAQIGVKKDSTTEDGQMSIAAAKKRHRPPKVATPNEARMRNIVQALYKIQRDGDVLYEGFETLPHAKDYPDYYEHVKNPMSIEMIKRNVKKKVYGSDMDAFVRDLKLIFQNAQFYNEDGSGFHEDATYILSKLDDIISAEVKRPDTDFVNVIPPEKTSTTTPNAKLSRTGVDQIPLRGESYRVGDWVFLENANDAKVPIIAQIFRTWQNSDGQYWVNVCWYYRPHQTVHRADKLWYENEVVKTGQYRDHPASAITGRCYVMYVTKYIRGRPTDWLNDEDLLYVCENRYNEEVKSFNKIKAWKSCVPEESREQCSNYDMILFPSIRQPKKVLSPLLHLLPQDKSLWITPTEEQMADFVFPEPRDRGSPNGPPILGEIVVTGVPDASRLGELNRTSSSRQEVQNAGGTPSQRASTSTGPGATPKQVAGAAFSTSKLGVNGQSMPSTPNIPNPYAVTSANGNTKNPYSVPNTIYAQTPGAQTQSHYANPSRQGSMKQTQTPATRVNPPTSNVPVLPSMPANTNKINSLGSQINPTNLVFIDSLGIAEPVRKQFLTDEKGDIVWFTVPPQDSVKPAQPGRAEGHTLAYLAWKRRKLMDKADAMDIDKAD